MQNWDRLLEGLPRHRAWVEIDLAAIAHNVRQIKEQLAEQAELLAVVKADAYGHGAVGVAKTALQSGATWLGVATVTEGVELRRAGISAPILLLGAIHTPEEIRAIAHWKIQPTLCSPKQALIFSETLTEIGRSLPVHLKLDTGMSRLGTPWQGAVEFAEWVKRLPGLTLASVYSHLATADDLDQTMLWEQHQRFEKAIQQLRDANIHPPRLHLANSAGTLIDSQLHYDLVRVGLLLYGIYPAPHLGDQFEERLKLKPALQVKARVTQVKTIEAGTGVSYGHRFVAQRDMRIAVVGVGYADGIPRLLSNRMEALIRGQRVAQIGSVTMDQLMIDVSQLVTVETGDVVTLLGRSGSEQITVDDWANTIGTISWEILCGFKHRLPRVAIGSRLELQESTENTRNAV
jgi:alanine racemase